MTLVNHFLTVVTGVTVVLTVTTSAFLTATTAGAAAGAET